MPSRIDIRKPSPTKPRLFSPALRRHRREDPVPDRRRFLMSMAGCACPRDLYFRAEGAKGTDATRTTARSFFLIRALLDSRDAIGPDASLFESARLLDVPSGVEAWGLADLVVRDPDTGANDLACRLHSVPAAAWADAASGAAPADAAEANLLAYALHAPRWSVAYVNETTGELVEYAGDTDAEAARRVMARFVEVAGFRESRRIPRCALANRRVPGELTPCCYDEWRMRDRDRERLAAAEPLKPLGNVALGLTLTTAGGV